MKKQRSQGRLNEILGLLSTINQVAEMQYDTKIIGVFGSTVRGEEKTTSDIDILVQPGSSATLVQLIGLSNYLKKSLGKKVDVVSENALKERVKSNIYKDLIRL